MPFQTNSKHKFSKFSLREHAPILPSRPSQLCLGKNSFLAMPLYSANISLALLFIPCYNRAHLICICPIPQIIYITYPLGLHLICKQLHPQARGPRVLCLQIRYKPLGCATTITYIIMWNFLVGKVFLK